LSLWFLKPLGYPIAVNGSVYGKNALPIADRCCSLLFAVSATGGAHKRPQVIRPRAHNPRSKVVPISIVKTTG
ncbi:MAG: hypothetical protein IKZ21_00800, partial [Clostridia bacterium]|nr:hypothetical protein [Clostridia bacterium]